MRSEPNLRIEQYRCFPPGFESPPGVNYGLFARGLLREACDAYDKSTMWVLTDQGWSWYERAKKEVGDE